MKRYYSMETNGRTTDIYIFGNIVDAFETGLNQAFDIDTGEVSGLSIAKEIKDLDVDTINVHIDSRGGYTSEGLTIYNTLKNHPAKVVTYCDGFACSAASLVFEAGDERIMGAASAMYVHNAWSDAEGNAAQLRQQADVLEKISQAAGNAYAEKVNISREELDAMLDGDNHEGTWLLPNEAVKMGFATAVSSEKESSIANQSAMSMILKKITSKPVQTEPTVQVSLDTDKLAGAVVEKLMAKVQPPQEQTTKENNPLKFLSALMGGKD